MIPRCAHRWPSRTPGRRYTGGPHRPQQLGGGGKAQLVHVEQQPPCDPETPHHVAGAIEMRIVDEPLPPHRGPRLLEVDPHHQAKRIGDPVPETGEAAGVLQRGERIVDGARPDDHQQPAIMTGKNPADGGPPRKHGRGHPPGNRQLRQQRAGRFERLKPGDMDVAGFGHARRQGRHGGLRREVRRGHKDARR